MGYQSINFIDPNWDQWGGKIMVHKRVYQLIATKGKMFNSTPSGKALVIREGSKPVFAPTSMCYVYSSYKGANNWVFYLFIDTKMYNEKLIEMRKKSLLDKLESIQYYEKDLNCHLTETFSTRNKQTIKRHIDRLYDKIDDYCEIKCEFFN